MSRLAPRSARPALDLLEQAVALLRRTPGSVLVLYYVGAVPFWLGLMYFVADASRSAFAGERLGQASLVTALLFLHMKCWHAVFGSKLRELLTAGAEPWSLARVWRLVLTQAAWQPTGLLVRPLAYPLTLPTVWVSGFYQNLTLLGDGALSADGRSPVRRALAQASRLPVQAHGMHAALLLFGFFVWLNVAVVLANVPGLLKVLFAWETMASRTDAWYANSTFVTVTLSLTFLVLDPLWKSALALRCFYGESIRTGADLKMALRGVPR